MIAALKNRNFFLLWLGGLISMIGTWMLLTALPFYIYEVTGSALATSGLLMAYIAPGVLFGSVAGVFVDRWDRKRVMLVSSLIQAAIIPLLLLVNANGWFWLIYVVAFIESTVNQFLSPAENALLPNLVDDKHLVSANSLNALNDNLARIIGAALGGVLLGAVGLNNVVIIDSLSYLIAAALIALVVVAPTARPSKSDEAANGSRWLQVWQEWIGGLRLVAQNDVLRNLFIVIGIALFGDAILSALLPVFAQDVAGFTAADYGWLLTARGIGGIIGGIVIAQLGPKLSASQMITGGLVLTGLAILGMILYPTLTVVITLMILAGPALMAWIISMQTVLQQASEDSFRGRVFGAYGTTSTVLMFIGSGLAGLLADSLGTALLMGSAAVIYVIAGLAGWILLRKPLRQMTAPPTS